MYVRDLTRISRVPPGGDPSRPSTTSARSPLGAPNREPIRAASSSATRKPTLCRCPAYVGPGLPRPTTIHGSMMFAGYPPRESDVLRLGGPLGLLGALGLLGDGRRDAGFRFG